jgi:cytochrome c-type biogenesis protein CcmH/NrfG
MTNNSDVVTAHDVELLSVVASNSALNWPSVLGDKAPVLLEQMFRDPRVLEPQERGALIEQLREAVAIAPHVPEVHVLLGMTLCVDLQVQEALEELRHAAKMAPDCFIARLKFGELLMRLRICRQAEEETHKAAKLATNAIQSEMARKQAAMIRTMLREGVERGGYAGILSRFFHFRPRSSRRTVAPVLVGSK